jgi:serine/threonine protein kinase
MNNNNRVEISSQQATTSNNAFLNKITNSINAKKRQTVQQQQQATSLPKLGTKFSLQQQQHDPTPSPTDVMVNKFMVQLEQKHSVSVRVNNQHYHSNNNNNSSSEESSVSDSTASASMHEYESSDEIINNVFLGSSSFNNYRTSRSWSHSNHLANTMNERRKEMTSSSVASRNRSVSTSSSGSSSILNSTSISSSTRISSPMDNVKMKKLKKKRKKTKKTTGDSSSSSSDESETTKSSKWFSKSKFDSTSGSDSEVSSDIDQSQDSNETHRNIDQQQLQASTVSPSQLEVHDKRDVLMLFLLQHICRQYNPDASFFTNMCSQLLEAGYLSDQRYLDHNFLREACKEFMVDVIKNWPIAFNEEDNNSQSKTVAGQRIAKLKRSESVGSFLSGLNADSDKNTTATKKGQHSTSPVTLPFFDFMFYSTSRFKSDFQQKTRIGKGAFGSVYRSVHRIDSHEYAIKKVKFSFRNAHELETTYTKVIREVKLLAKLDHVNIVRYNQAWFEQSRSDIDYSSDEEEEDEEEEEENDNATLSDDASESAPLTTVPTNHSRVDSNAVAHYLFPSTLQQQEHESTTDGTQFKFDEEADPLSPYSAGTTPVVNPPNVTFECYTSDEDTLFDDVPFSKSPKIEIPPSPDYGMTYLMSNKQMSQQRQQQMLNQHKQQQQQDTSSAPSPSTTGNQSVQQAVKNMLSQMFNESKNKFEMFLFIQMQLCKQNTLQDYLNSEERVKNKQIDYQTSMNYFKQLADGVQHIHERSLIHRDLKPKNIFISADNTIKIGDFGLAKFVKDNIVHTKHSNTTTEHKRETQIAKLSTSYDHTSGVGTYFYASPEQYQGSAYDEKSDIFSLGIILFELLCAFGSGHERALILNELRAGIIPSSLLDQYPDEMDLVKRCIEQDPSHRPTAKDVLSTTVNIMARRSSESVSSPRSYNNQKQVEKLLQEKDDEILRLKQELEQLRRMQLNQKPIS